MEQSQPHSGTQTRQQQEVRKQTQQQPQSRQRSDDGSHKCPNCHADLPEQAEFCPHCGKKFVSYCTFCGASMEPGEAVCEECGMPASGVKCPKCGTLNFRAFCSHCNEPLTRTALRAVEKAKQDPKVQKAAALMDKATVLEEKIEQLKSSKRKPAQPKILTESERMMMELTGQKQEVAETPQEGTGDLDAILKEYHETVKELNTTFEQMLPPNGATPQEQFNYASARKVAVEATRKVLRKVIKKVPTEWVCNYCGCHHTKPSDCVRPHLGGTWIYRDIEVDAEVIETYKTYKHV